MICKYCGKETDAAGGVCPACEYRRAHPTNANSVDIYSSSGVQEEKTFHIEIKPDESTSYNDSAAEVPLYTKQSAPGKRKLSTRGKVIIAAAVAVLLSVVVIIALTVGSPAKKIVKAFEEGNYDAAYNTFIKNYDTNGSATLTAVLGSRIDEIIEQYRLGEIEYSAVSAELETVKKMGISSLATNIEQAQKKVEKLKTSKDSFTAAEKHYTDRNYSLAIAAYKKVIKDDVNYSAAAKKLESSVMTYRNSALSEAAELVSDGDYAAGVKTLETALAVLEKDELIEKRIKEYKKSAEGKSRAEIIETADRYAYKGDYEAAIKAVQSAFELKSELSDDKTLKSNLEYYTDKYMQSIKADVAELSDAGNYTAAAELIKQAEALVGENKEITDMREGLAGKLPVYLDSLTPKDSNEWSFGDDTTLDSFGVDRSGEENCIALSAKSTATYDISKGYEFFSCYVAAAKDIDEAVKCRIKVTASIGGEVRFRECEISAETEAQELKFNVSECSELKFEVTGEGASIIMYGVCLTLPTAE